MAQNRPLELTVTGSPSCSRVYMSHGTGSLKPESTDELRSGDRSVKWFWWWGVRLAAGEVINRDPSMLADGSFKVILIVLV